jgi:hypothetical protein
VLLASWQSTAEQLSARSRPISPRLLISVDTHSPLSSPLLDFHPRSTYLRYSIGVR